MQIDWTREALTQLAEIKSFIAQDKPEAAQRVAAHLWSSVERLVDFPLLGRPGPVKGLRTLVVPPYTVTYRVLADRVRIMSVWDGRRLKI